MAASIASKMRNGLTVVGPGLVMVAGSFQINGGSAPLAVKGKGFTVAFTSTGTWTVTLANAKSCKAIVSTLATMAINSAANVDVYAQMGACSASAGTFVIRVMTATVATTPATDVSNRVNFMFILATSSINS